MCLVLFGWLSIQDYFKELSNTDIRKQIQDKHNQSIEEDIMPFGFVEDGLDYSPDGYEREASW